MALCMFMIHMGENNKKRGKVFEATLKSPRNHPSVYDYNPFYPKSQFTIFFQS